MTAPVYHYRECGLDNVLLEGLPVCTDDAGEEVVTIPNLTGLHRAILLGVLDKESGLQPRELRFVRTELGLTQAEVAALVGKDAQTVGRWERGETAIEPAAETVVRVLAHQHLGGDSCAVPRIEDLARRTIISASQPPFRIDATNPDDYRLMAANDVSVLAEGALLRA